ncbi:MAG: phosphoribosyltransferase family protein [Microgenomates group bacterium]
MWQSIRQVLLETIFPPQCCQCKTLGRLLCNDCYQRLEFIPNAFQPCAEPPLDSISVACTYAGGAKALLKALKLKRVIGVAETLAWLLYETCAIPEADYIVAAPANPKNFVQRGFDPALEISRELSAHSGIPLAPLLYRINSAQEQKHLNRADRIKNLTNSLKCIRGPTKNSKKSVLLVDDVVTSGATMMECARVLKNAGFKRVFGLAVAHGY